MRLPTLYIPWYAHNILDERTPCRSQQDKTTKQNRKFGERKFQKIRIQIELHPSRKFELFLSGWS
jgi:hypothetical protein